MAHFPHVTYKSRTETKECSFARGFQTYSSATHTLTTDKLVRSFSVFVKCGRKTFCEIGGNESLMKQHVQKTSIMCLYSCLSYPTLKKRLFYSALHYHVWPILLYHIFSTLTHKCPDFRRKKIIEHEICVLTFSTNFCLKHFSFYEELGRILSQ
jgi:hypothetical protein